MSDVGIYQPIKNYLFDQDIMIIDDDSIGHLVFNKVATKELAYGAASRINIDILKNNNITPNTIHFWQYVKNYIDFQPLYHKIMYIGTCWHDNKYINDVIIHAKPICDIICICDFKESRLKLPDEFIKKPTVFDVNWYIWLK